MRKNKIREKLQKFLAGYRIFPFFLEFSVFSHFFKGMNKDKIPFFLVFWKQICLLLLLLKSKDESFAFCFLCWSFPITLMSLIIEVNRCDNDPREQRIYWSERLLQKQVSHKSNGCSLWSSQIVACTSSFLHPFLAGGRIYKKGIPTTRKLNFPANLQLSARLRSQLLTTRRTSSSSLSFLLST